MSVRTSIRFLTLCLVWQLAGTAACGLAIGSADLGAVNCEQEGKIGPPACAERHLCANGQCMACAPSEVCTNGLDDDCDDGIDNGCPGAGGKGGAGGNNDASAASGGAPDASKDTSQESHAGSGGSSGSTTSGGSAGNGGVSGNGGEASGGVSGSSGSAAQGGAAPTGGMGGDPGTGGSPPPTGGSGGAQCKAFQASCVAYTGDDECCNGHCCINTWHCGNSLGSGCDFKTECCIGDCIGGICI